MTEPAEIVYPDLLNNNDFQTFLSKSPIWFLGAAGERIRDYCGWHIWPRKDDHYRAKVGDAGIIMLPTLELHNVATVMFRGFPLSPDEYRWDNAGFITWYRYRQAVNPGTIIPYPLYGPHNAYVEVDFEHGFDVLPRVVAEVGYELASRAMQRPAGIVTDMTRGPIRTKFGDFGAELSQNEKDRLAPYTVLGVGR